MFFPFRKIGIVGSLVLVFLSACTLNTKPVPTSTPAPPTVTATPNIVIATPVNNLPVVGFPNLTANGVTPCVVKNTGSSDVMVYDQPGTPSTAVAILQSGAALPAFKYQDGWYQAGYNLGTQQVSGWVAELVITIDGDCMVLHPLTICSVQPSVGRLINLYAQPDVTSQIIGALGDRYSIPFLEMNSDGWFRVDVGSGQSGWIAPDEGQLAGPCTGG